MSVARSSDAPEVLELGRWREGKFRERTIEWWKCCRAANAAPQSTRPNAAAEPERSGASAASQHQPRQSYRDCCDEEGEYGFDKHWTTLVCKRGLPPMAALQHQQGEHRRGEIQHRHRTGRDDRDGNSPLLELEPSVWWGLPGSETVPRRRPAPLDAAGRSRSLMRVR
jgi:hypothetical protein